MYGFFEGQLTPWSSQFTKSIVSNYKSLHFPGKIEDLPNWYVITHHRAFNCPTEANWIATYCIAGIIDEAFNMMI